MYKNPMSKGVIKISKDITDTRINRLADILPAIIKVVVCLIILALFCMLWVYGLFSVIEQIIKISLIKSTLAEVKEKKDTTLAMSYYLLIGLYLVFWLPFYILALPFTLLELIVKLIYKQQHNQ